MPCPSEALPAGFVPQWLRQSCCRWWRAGQMQPVRRRFKRGKNDKSEGFVALKKCFSDKSQNDAGGRGRGHAAARRPARVRLLRCSSRRGALGDAHRRSRRE